MAVELGPINAADAYASADLRHVEVSLAAIPNGDWSMGGWAQCGSLAGNHDEYLGRVAPTAGAKMDLIVGSGRRSGSGALKVKGYYRQTTDIVPSTLSTALILTDTPFLWIAQVRSGTFEVYICPIGGTPVLYLSVALAGAGGMIAKNWRFGERFTGVMHDGWVATSAINPTDIQALSANPNLLETLVTSGNRRARLPLATKSDTTNLWDGTRPAIFTGDWTAIRRDRTDLVPKTTNWIVCDTKLRHRTLGKAWDAATATMRLTGRYGGATPSTLEGRVVKGDGTEHVTWTTLTSATISGGNWSGQLAVPPCNERVYLEVRDPVTGTTWIDTAAWVVGAAPIGIGQSPMSQMFSANPGNAAALTTPTYMLQSDTTLNWYELSPVSSSFQLGGAVDDMANRYAALGGGPFAAINGAQVGTSMAEWSGTETVAMGTGTGSFTAGETLVAGDGATAKVASYSGTSLKTEWASRDFIVGDILTGQTSGAVRTVTAVTTAAGTVGIARCWPVALKSLRASLIDGSAPTFYWLQGAADPASSLSKVTEHLDRLIARINAALAGQPYDPVTFVLIPHQRSTDSPAAQVTTRMSQWQWAHARSDYGTRTLVGVPAFDAVTDAAAEGGPVAGSTSPHLSALDTGYPRQARRFAHHIAWVAGWTDWDGNGGQISSVTYPEGEDGRTLTVTITAEDGSPATGLRTPNGGNVYGFEVSDDNFVTTRPHTATIAGDKVVITQDSAPADPTLLKVRYLILAGEPVAPADYLKINDEVYDNATPGVDQGGAPVWPTLDGPVAAESMVIPGSGIFRVDVYRKDGGTTELVGQMDPTLDMDKPVSTAQDAADVAVQAYAVQRSHHTGTQLSTTISDFTEAVQDAVAALLAAGTGATLTYDDAANTLTITSTGGGGGLDAEAVRDAIGVALVGVGTITVTVNDAADTITISTTATNRANHTGSQLASTISDLSEAIDDRVAALLTAGTGVTLTYDDAAGTLTVTASGGGGGSDLDANGHLPEVNMGARSRRISLMRRTGASGENMSRREVTAGTSIASGQLQIAAFPLLKGEVITSLTFVSGSTGATTPTNQWFALYDANLGLLRVTNDDTTTAWGTNTAKTLTLATPYTVTADGLFYVACMVKAATPPSICGTTSQQGVMGLAPVLGGRDSTHTGLTDPSTAPATAALTASAFYPYASYA